MAKKCKDFTAEEWQELRTIANSYGVTLGGYQNNHGYTVYTSERVVYGDTKGEVTTNLHACGRDAQKRIKRTIARTSK